MTNPPPATQDLAAALNRHFGFPDFLAGQEEAVRCALDGQDVVLIMPTGSGKSLCYQLTALLLDGVSVIVSPLIALMKDQVDGLTARGIPATFINSSLSADEMRDRIEALAAGRCKLVYVAPERFRIRSFTDALKRVNVSLLAVDEAHCISQWGHDFRPDYLRLRQVVEELPTARIMALTATATPHVRSDIVKQLGLGEGGRREPVVRVHGFARPNLRLAVHLTATHDQKLRCIENLLEGFPTGIVYCSTRKQTERVYELLQKSRHACTFYHAGMTDEERRTTQERFMNREAPVVVATNAFGMGVDRQDLRFVVHWDIPGSLEAYYQEIGRAGRDGEPSRCELLFNYADVRTQEFFLEGANPTPADVTAVWNTVRKDCARGAVARSLEDWTERAAATRNEMTVRTAMAILERAGLVRREIEAGQRKYTTSLVADADANALETQFSHLEEKRRRDERKLKEMLRYATTPGCRHAAILNYFGERDVSVPCHACDQCGSDTRPDRRAPTEEEWVVLQKVLSCAARMDGRYGRARLGQVLRGVEEPDLTARKLHELPTYGLLRDRSAACLRAIIDELIRDGSLALSNDEYQLVSLTTRGREVMLRKTAPSLVWPEANAPVAAKSRSSRKSEEPGQYDEALFARLKAWRLETARRERVPAYVILHDAALKAVAAARPGSLADLESVHGFGPSKIARYGDAILDVIDSPRNS